MQPVSWTLYALLTSQLGNVQATIEDFEGNTVTIAQFMEERFGYSYDMVGPIIAILLAFVLIFRGLSVYALACINFQKR